MEQNELLEKRFGFKEASETDYWFLLLHKTAYLTKDPYAPLNADIASPLKLLVSIIKILKKKNPKYPLPQSSIINYPFSIIN